MSDAIETHLTTFTGRSKRDEERYKKKWLELFPEARGQPYKVVLGASRQDTFSLCRLGTPFASWVRLAILNRTGNRKGSREAMSRGVISRWFNWWR